MTTLQPRLDIAVRSPSRAARLRRTRLPAPLHLAGSLARYPWLSLGDRLRFARAALALRAVDAADPATDLRGFGDWLRAHGQSASAVHTLWELVGIATLNARADDASLALAATVFQIGMLRDNSTRPTSGGLPCRCSGCTATPPPMRCAGSGGAVHLRTTVRSLHRGSDGWIAETDGGHGPLRRRRSRGAADCAGDLLPDGALDVAARMGAATGQFADRQYASDPRPNGAGRSRLSRPSTATLQWVFDRTHRSRPGLGQYLAVSVSAADELIDVPTANCATVSCPRWRS